MKWVMSPRSCGSVSPPAHRCSCPASAPMCACRSIPPQWVKMRALDWRGRPGGGPPRPPRPPRGCARLPILARMKRLLVLFILASSAAGAASPDPAAVAAKARMWRAAHEREIVSELTTLLAIPNLASDAPNIERNAAAIVAMLERRGVKARLIREPGVPPLVVGDLAAPGAMRTIAYYAHYDGQPVDATQWISPPWAPVLRDANGKAIDAGSVATFDPEWRVLARSAGDDKGTIIAMLAALDAPHAGRGR